MLDEHSELLIKSFLGILKRNFMSILSTVNAIIFPYKSKNYPERKKMNSFKYQNDGIGDI